MGNKNKTIALGIITAIAAIALIACIVAVVTNRSSDDDAEALGEPDTAVSGSESTEQSGNSENGDQEATVISDALGRRVLDYGDVGKPLTKQSNDAPDLCSEKEKTRAPEGLEIQQVGGVATVWSSSDGPTDTSPAGTPKNHARTVAGAALAAMNFMALSTAHDAQAGEVMKNDFYWGPEMQGKIDEALNSAQQQNNTPGKPIDIPAVAAHKVVNCSDDQLVIDLAQPRTADDQGKKTATFYQVVRVPVMWKDGQWKLNALDPNDPFRETVDALDGSWAEWKF